MDTNVALRTAVFLLALALLGLALLVSAGSPNTPPEPTLVWATNTPAPTEIVTWTPSSTYTVTATIAPSPSASPSPTPTASASPTSSATFAPTDTDEPTPTQEFFVTTEDGYDACLRLDMPRTCTVKALIVITKRTPQMKPYLTLRFEGDGALTNHANWTGSVLYIEMAGYVTVSGALIYRTANTVLSCCADTVSITKSAHVTIENSTLLWGVDGTLDVSGSSDVTIRYSIVAESLRNATHLKGAHDKLTLVDNSYQVRYLNVVMVSAGERLPRVVNSGEVTVCGSVIYNHRSHANYVSSVSSVNYSGNWWRRGLDTPGDVYAVAIVGSALNGSRVYVDDLSIVRPADRTLISASPVFPLVACDDVSETFKKAGAPGRLHTARILECLAARSCRIVDVTG